MLFAGPDSFFGLAALSDLGLVFVQGDLDRRAQLAVAVGLHQVAVGMGAAGPPDRLLVGIRGHVDDRHVVLRAN